MLACEYDLESAWPGQSKVPIYRYQYSPETVTPTLLEVALLDMRSHADTDRLHHYMLANCVTLGFCELRNV